MRLIIVDRVDQALFLDLIAGLARLVEVAEHQAQFAGIGLAKEGVELLDQRRNAGLFMHRLVG